MAKPAFQIPKCRKGDLVAATFRDHAEGTDHFEFTVYGRVIRQSDIDIVICCWHYSDLKASIDPHDTNVIVHTIIKAAITGFKKFKAV